MLTAKQSSEEYFKWIRESTTFEDLKSGITRIDVPFLDSSSDEIVMYIVQGKNDLITLTDDGWTIDNLESRGVSISRSPKRKSMLTQQLKSYGVNNEDGELTITTTFDRFAASKHRLLQAILFVNDMFMLAPSTTKGLFFDDVSTYFSAHEIRTTKNMSYVGESGLTHKYEFSIPGINKVPMKLIKTMSAPNNSTFAKAILADVEQTRPILSDPSSFYVFLNDKSNKNKDQNISINPDILKLFNMNHISPIIFSEREKYVKELSK